MFIRLSSELVTITSPYLLGYDELHYMSEGNCLACVLAYQLVFAYGTALATA